MARLLARKARILEATRVLVGLVVVMALATPSFCTDLLGDAPSNHKRIAEISSPFSDSPYYSSAGGGGYGSLEANAAVSVPKYSRLNELKYFKGPLVVVQSPVYVILYGNWKNGTAALTDRTQKLVRSFIASISTAQPSGPGSVAAWWRTNSLFAQKNGKLVTTKVALGSVSYDWYSQGKNLADDSSQVYKVVKRFLDKRKTPPPANAMFAVLTSADVRVGSDSSGFCSLYCGFHDSKLYTIRGTARKVPVYYAFVGEPSIQCPGSCGLYMPTPSGNSNADALVDTLAHELAEIATDPDCMTGYLTDQGAWGQENADLCRRNYLQIKTATSIARRYQYNLVGAFGSRFMIQSLYNPVKAGCTMYP